MSVWRHARARPCPRTITLVTLVAWVALTSSCTSSERSSKAGTERDHLPGVLRLVGHAPLFARGMNAGLAVWHAHAYVGSRTDGSPGHPHAGVVVVDVRDPRAPLVVGEIGPPLEGNIGETSRELRVWPAARLLLVLNFACDPEIHGCTPSGVDPSIRFYDIGGQAAGAPELVSTYHPSRLPHEFFLWVDPGDAERALLYLSTPNPGEDQLLVTDISGARQGRFDEIATWSTSFPDPGSDDTLHSVSVSSDGRTALLAHLTAGFLLLDTSEVAEGAPHPQIRTLTELASRPQWPGPGAHSAVAVPGRDLALTTDEVYGASVGGGCPWGWVRLIDVSDPVVPTVVSEFRVRPFNEADYCDEVDDERNASSSLSSHNPTLTANLALVSWYSAGLVVISTEDPHHPAEVARFVPEPLAAVATEDPLLSSGRDKVVMWSYPIIEHGLVYVVDVRNGLFILSYDGPHEDEVDETPFLEGNSDIGASRKEA
jgi:hypothetical protein